MLRNVLENACIEILKFNKVRKVNLVRFLFPPAACKQQK